MSLRRLARIALLTALAFTAITSMLGGAVLVVAAVVDLEASPIAIPPSYLEESPFGSTLVPGLALAVVVGGLHVVAFVLVARRRPFANAAASVAGFAILVWIFVQMVWIPFSPLQAVYFIVGLVELGAVLVLLGVLERRPGAQGGSAGAASVPLWGDRDTPPSTR